MGISMAGGRWGGGCWGGCWPFRRDSSHCTGSAPRDSEMAEDSSQGIWLRAAHWVAESCWELLTVCGVSVLLSYGYMCNLYVCFGCVTVLMLQLHLKHTHRSPPLSPWHIFALRDKCPCHRSVWVCACLFCSKLGVSVCLLQHWNPKSHSDSMSVFTWCAHVCARVCWRQRPGLWGATCGRVGRMFSAPGQGGSPDPGLTSTEICNQDWRCSVV